MKAKMLVTLLCILTCSWLQASRHSNSRAHNKSISLDNISKSQDIQANNTRDEKHAPHTSASNYQQKSSPESNMHEYAHNKHPKLPLEATHNIIEVPQQTSRTQGQQAIYGQAQGQSSTHQQEYSLQGHDNGHQFAQNAQGSSVNIHQQSLLHHLNDEEFVQDILPNNFSCLTQLLQKKGKSRDYADAILRLVGDKLKGVEYTNPQAVGGMLDGFTKYMPSYFTMPQTKNYIQGDVLAELDMLDRFTQTVNNFLYGQFLNDYDTFKADPIQFLKLLSKEIGDVAHEELSMAQLRATIVRFLDTTMTRLVWHPQEPEHSWEAVKDISNKLATLVDSNVIDSLDDLNSLYWTLLHRYCYFIKLFGPSLPVSLYATIHNDIQSQKLLFLELEEQEEWLTTKADHLEKIITTAEAKSRAYERGILTK